MPTPPTSHLFTRMRGFLLKRSDGKADGHSVGSKLAKWNRRYFVLSPANGDLAYYRDHKDLSRPAGCMKLAGCEVKRLPPEPRQKTVILRTFPLAKSGIQ